jgi:hypothetical protein
MGVGTKAEEVGEGGVRRADAWEFEEGGERLVVGRVFEISFRKRGFGRGRPAHGFFALVDDDALVQVEELLCISGEFKWLRSCEFVG